MVEVFNVKSVRVVFFVFHLHLVLWCRCSTSLIVRSHVLSSSTTIQTSSILNVHGKELPKQPKRIRSLDWVWPNGWPSTNHRLWAEALQHLQLHGHSAHADPFPRQPPRFPEPGRRCRDFHRWPGRFAALRRASSRTAARRVLSPLGTPSLWKQMEDHVSSRPGIQETGAISDRKSVATTFFSPQSNGIRDRDTTFCSRWKTDKISKKNRTESWLNRPRRDDGSAKVVLGWGWGWGKKSETEKFRLCFSADQSRILITAISTTPRKSMGRSGSEGLDWFVWRIGDDK